MTLKAMGFDHACQEFQERVPVLIIKKDRHSSVAAGRDVITESCSLNPERSRHET